MRRHFAPSLVVLSACGMAEADFVPEYAQLWCEHRLACEDDAVLRFDGVASTDDCVERTLPRVTTWGNGCSFDGVQAEACLIDVGTLTCPAGDAALAPPPSCDAVYLDCRGGDGTIADDSTQAGETETE